MGKILILEDIAKEILNSNKESTLFGERNYELGDFGNYDFIFDYITGIPLETFKKSGNLKSPYLMVPVFSNPSGSDQSILRMNETHKEIPQIDTFAIRDNKSRKYTQFGKTQEKPGPFLEFYSLNKFPHGMEISEKEDYFSVNEETLKENMPVRIPFEQDILMKRKDIKKRYKI